MFFVCTDDKNSIPDICDFIKQEFNINNILIHDTIRTDNGTAIHLSYRSPEDLVKSADDAILDSVSLSKCETVVGLNSNVSNFALILNPKLKLYRIDNPENNII
jgi:hypothetical protein